MVLEKLRSHREGYYCHGRGARDWAGEMTLALAKAGADIVAAS